MRTATIHTYSTLGFRPVRCPIPHKLRGQAQVCRSSGCMHKALSSTAPLRFVASRVLQSRLSGGRCHIHLVAMQSQHEQAVAQPPQLTALVTEQCFGSQQVNTAPSTSAAAQRQHHAAHVGPKADRQRSSSNGRSRNRSPGGSCSSRASSDGDWTTDSGAGGDSEGEPFEADELYDEQADDVDGRWTEKRRKVRRLA